MAGKPPGSPSKNSEAIETITFELEIPWGSRSIFADTPMMTCIGMHKVTWNINDPLLSILHASLLPNLNNHVIE